MFITFLKIKSDGQNKETTNILSRRRERAENGRIRT